jgi:hypothetical protein
VLGKRGGAGGRRAGRKRHGLLAVGVEDEADHDRLAGQRRLRELHEQVVVGARVRPGDALVGPLDDQGHAVLGRCTEVDGRDHDARRVVVADHDLDVAHACAVEERVARDDAVLRHDDAVTLRARVVLGEEEDALRRGPVAGDPAGEGEHHRAAGLVDDLAVHDLVALELRALVALSGRAGAEAEPQRVGVAVRERGRVAARRDRVGERVVGLFLRRARARHGHVDERARVRCERDRVAVDLGH